jgi:type I restriction-modification system DNA methylase subunit
MPDLEQTIKMILHGIDSPIKIRHDNTLSRPLRDYGPKDRVYVIVTNPPFGGRKKMESKTTFRQPSAHAKPPICFSRSLFTC